MIDAQPFQTCKSEMNDNGLHIRNLKKAYGKKQVLKGCNLILENGEIVGLIGPNGCGKTTLMKTVLGFLRQDEGTVELNGKELSAQKNAVGIIESPHFYPELTAADNLAYLAPSYSREDFKKYAETFGLEKDLGKKVSQYSYGMKQKLAIIFVLLQKERQIWIFDEPTNGLDVDSKRLFISLVRDAAKKHDKTVFVSSHDMFEMDKLCDSIYFLRNGVTSIKTDVRAHSEENAYFVEFVDENACSSFISSAKNGLELTRISSVKIRIKNVTSPPQLAKSVSKHGIVELKKDVRALSELYDELKG